MSSARKTASMSLAQIRIEDGWVLDGFVRRAVEQDASLVQDEDALDGPEQDLEAMFDDHEGKAVLPAVGGDAVEDFLRELRRDARGGFVEQQELRLRHPGSRDLEPLLDLVEPEDGGHSAYLAAYLAGRGGHDAPSPTRSSPSRRTRCRPP